MTDKILHNVLPSLEMKADESGRIEGYCSTFGNLDLGGDIVNAGAFKASLDKHARDRTSVALLWYHDPARPIGRWTDLHEDGKGLYGVGKINLDTSAGRDAFASVAAGDVSGLSIGYRTKRAERLPQGGNRLIEVDLQEVSIVTFPMNPASRITGVKHLATKAEAIEFLRAGGLSKEAARRFVAGGFGALCQEESNSHEHAKSLIRMVENATDQIRRMKR